MTSCTGSARRGFLGILKKSVELRTRHRTRRVDFRGSQRPDELARYGRRTRWGGGTDGKAIVERLCISLPYVETFNSTVIKGFVPELRSCYVFFVFRDSYVLCIYVMNILYTFHVSVSWVWNIIKIGLNIEKNWENLLSLRTLWNPISKFWLKNFQGVRIKIMIMSILSAGVGIHWLHSFVDG